MAVATLSLSLASCHGGVRPATASVIAKRRQPSGSWLAKPDYAAGTTVPYRGPCKNPDLQAATGTVEQWTGGESFHRLKHLTTMAMGLTGDGSVLFVWAGATDGNPQQGLIITDLEPKDFCVSTTFGPMYESIDPIPRGVIELVGPVLGDTIHYSYLDSAGHRLPGQAQLLAHEQDILGEGPVGS